MMSKFSESPALIGQLVSIPLCDRWRVHSRLQELAIPCWCHSDGSLHVEINHGIALVLIRSTIQHVTAPRRELVDWLERCWETNVVCKQNH